MKNLLSVFLSTIIKRMFFGQKIAVSLFLIFMTLFVNGVLVEAQEVEVSEVLDDTVDRFELEPNDDEGGDIERVGEASADYDGPSEYSAATSLSTRQVGSPIWGGHLLWVTVTELRYDDNVLYGAGRRASDVVSILTGGFDWTFPSRSGSLPSVGGNQLSGSYRAGYEIFLDGVAENNVRNSLSLTGTRVFRRAEVDISYDLFTGTTPDVQEGGRIARVTHSPNVAARIALGRKLDATLGFRYQNTEVEDNIDTERLLGEGFIDYQAGAKTRLGLGTVVGSDQTSVGFNSLFEQFRLRSEYEVTERIQWDLYGGAEFRQFDADVESEFGPIFGLNLSYELSRSSTLDFSAERALRPSNFLPGQIRKDLTISLGMQQRFFLDYFLYVSGTIGRASFAQSTQGALGLGSQMYSVVSLQLTKSFINGLDGQIFYNRTGREGSAGRNALENNQTGIRLSYRF